MTHPGYSLPELRLLSMAAEGSPRVPFYQQAAAILRGVRAVSSSDIPLGGGAAMAAGSTDEMLRAARNQSLYREVNERIEDLNKRFDAAL